MAKYASTLVNVARGWLGCNERDGSHKKIIDLYNSHKPLARNYKVKYSDEWCATFISACSVKAGMTDLIPTECGCQEQIELFKKKGIWVEDESVVPKPGWIVFYDWQGSGVGDNRGWADHVGIVESCDGTNIVIIEGNKGEAVARRTIKVNARYLRGYGVPKFDKESVKVPNEETKDTDRIIWDYLMSKIQNAYGVAGLMGNLYAESGLKSNNAQNSGNTRLGMTDDEYTLAVDNGSYTNFIRDSIGYGLAQWTYWSRKETLLNFAKSKKVSIGNLEMQLEYLVKEIKGYRTVYKAITEAKTVCEAADAVLTGYEKPADMSNAVMIKRARYGQKYYDKYASKTTTTTKPSTPANKVVATESAQSFDRNLAGSYKVTANSGLHLRSGAGVTKKSLVVLPKGTIVKNYGYYTEVLGTKWLYIQVTLNGVQYTGFSSSKYLKK